MPEQVDDRCEGTCAVRPMRAVMHPFSIEHIKTENEQSALLTLTIHLETSCLKDNYLTMKTMINR